MPGMKMDHVGWCGDLSYGLAAIALLLTLVGVCTPSWIDTELNFARFIQDYPQFQTTFQPVQQVVGRGFFQAYEYNGYGLVTLIPYQTTDNFGKMDPFCGDSQNPTLFPSLRIISDANVTGIGFRGRSYRRGDWCNRRSVSVGFAIVSIILGLVAMLATFCAQRGNCGQLPFVVITFAVFLVALVTCASMGSFINQEGKRVNDIAINDRFFPFEQKTKIGYSFLCYLFGMLMFFLAAVLGMFEACVNGKKDTSTHTKKKKKDDSEA
eukprot:m.37718 g.37718  ORF g.37718 m.37718 type:complete len:266 (+) comp6755_c0_seq1:65-862(+)